jgi:starvation-inducible DNA-binding protein
MKASAELGSNLQSVLVDLIELHVQGKQAHWSVVGKNFRDLHLQLDEIIDDARIFTDELAERMRALDALPDGRTETVTKTTHLPKFPAGEVDTTETVGLITALLTATVDNIREVHESVDEEDPASADILNGFILKLEQYIWMVSAEDRKPRKATAKDSTRPVGKA